MKNLFLLAKQRTFAQYPIATLDRHTLRIHSDGCDREIEALTRIIAGIPTPGINDDIIAEFQAEIQAVRDLQSEILKAAKEG